MQQPNTTENSPVSIEPELKTKFVYSILTDVIGVKDSEPDWEWVHFDGSRESLQFPKGSFKDGDKVKITFERVT